MAIKSYRATDWNSNINLIVYFSLVMSAIGVGWMALNNVEAGVRYSLIFLMGIAILFLSFFFINEHQKDTIKKLIKNPFEIDYDVGVFFFILGWTVPIILSLIVRGIFGKTFNISQLMIPLAGTNIHNNIAQSFSIAQVQADFFWQWYVAVFTAGSIEEFVFGFILVLCFTIIAMLIWRMIAGDRNSNSSGAKLFYLIFGLVMTALIFGGMHKLNNTYVGTMFLVAILFRLGMNYLIYFIGIFLSFTIGYHQANNAVWYWFEYGAEATIKALLSVGGVIILIFFGVILFYFLRRIDYIMPKIGKVFSEIGQK